jgi:hypothetical protein
MKWTAQNVGHQAARAGYEPTIHEAVTPATHPFEHLWVCML